MIQGIDVSHWDGNINLPQMKYTKLDFIIFKATQGRWKVDEVFERYYDLATDFVRGAYHYLDWSTNGKSQAEFFWSKIKNKKLDFPPIVDFESRSGLGAYSPCGELYSFIKTLESASGRLPMIYTGPSYWSEFGSKSAFWADYPLWIANYGVVSPYIPQPWQKWFLWQYTPSGNGKYYGSEALGADLNYFNGTLEELKKSLNIPAIPPATISNEEKLERMWNAHPELH